MHPRQTLGVATVLAFLWVAVACGGSAEVSQVGLQTPVPSPQVEPVSPPPLAADEAHVVRVIDGVTIEVEQGGESHLIRYLGVAIPTDADPTGAVEFNRFLVAGRSVVIAADDGRIDSDGANLRYVFIDGEMANLKLLNSGWAVVADFPTTFNRIEEFLKAESEARFDGRGMWSAPTSPPVESVTVTAVPTPGPSRIGSTLPARPGAFLGPVGVCDYSSSNTPVIKGNVDRRTGERIYHVPVGLFYSTTAVEPVMGDRWFCTEAEAQALGWTRSKR